MTDSPAPNTEPQFNSPAPYAVEDHRWQLVNVPIQENDPDERYTPRWVFDGLGLTFDLDPASPVEGGDCVPARRKLTRLDDGLAYDWHGLVWLNPPFSQSTRWADKFRCHGNGVFLGPVANGAWWCRLVKAADIVWHCRDFAFSHPTHAGKRSSMPLAMIAIGAEATAAVRQLARSGVQDGVMVVPEVGVGQWNRSSSPGQDCSTCSAAPAAQPWATTGQDST